MSHLVELSVEFLLEILLIKIAISAMKRISIKK
jgi:hypothetical protein